MSIERKKLTALKRLAGDRVITRPGTFRQHRSRSRLACVTFFALLFVAVPICKSQENGKAQEKNEDPASHAKNEFPSVIEPANGSIILNPITIDREGLDFRGYEGLLFVPENRKIDGSRKIGIHFLWFRRKGATLPPVFFLPGGPGGAVEPNLFYEYHNGPIAKLFATEMTWLHESRDLVIVNQRGNYRGPGLQPEMRWHWDPTPLSQPTTIESAKSALRKTVREGVRRWSDKGVDLAGYDIHHLVDDVDDLRRALKFKRIALRGNSFGSQWSLAYMKRFPDRVERALLGGIEPLDHAWDSPAGVVAALKRLESRALANPKVAEAFSEKVRSKGITESFLDLAEHFDAKPIEIQLSGEKSKAIRLSGMDFRDYITCGFTGDRRRNLANWPQFMREILSGEYQSVAEFVAEDRQDTIGATMIGLLIDNSLGISAKREKSLDEEAKSFHFPGINRSYRDSRELTPTQLVNDSFRNFRCDVPILMIHGDIDFSTPVENAKELLPMLHNGQLVVVEGGTHNAIRELVKYRPQIARRLFRFMSDPKTRDSEEGFSDRVALPSISFEDPTQPFFEPSDQ